MSEIMKVFVGADEYDADFPLLVKLRTKSLAEGFYSFRNWINLQENLDDYPFKNTTAIIRGAYTGICVAHSAEFFLRKEINSILTDVTGSDHCPVGVEIKI